MKKYFIPLIFIFLLFGCTGSKPHISVSFLSTSPAQPYEGDEVTLTVNVVNSASVAANEFTVDVFATNAANNVSLKTEVLKLQPNSNESINISWSPYSAGVYNIVARVDAGNQVSDASADKESSMNISVKPSEGVELFSALPNRELQNVGIINITNEGIGVLYADSQAVQEFSNSTYFAFLRPYLSNLKDVQVGTADYVDGRHGVVLLIRGALSAERMSTIIASFIKLQTNMNSTLQHKTINGTDVSVFRSNALPAPLCIWRENGWLKLTAYIDSLTLETCDSFFGKYDASYANEPLGIRNELAKEPPFNATLLGTTLHLSNITNTSMDEYGAAFEDDEGFYIYYVTKEQYAAGNNTCFGRILNRSSEQICEASPANSTWAIVQRKVGNYVIACLSTPKSGGLTISVEQKAIDLCYSLNYSGEERTWVSILSVLKPRRCELPDQFSCASYNYTNSTLVLNITQNTGKTVMINGFGCSSYLNASKASFQLAQPITLPSNSSVILNAQCHDESNIVIGDSYVYFDTRLYLNYSITGSNTSKLVVGNLTLRNI
jgi:hypothetical protein